MGVLDGIKILELARVPPAEMPAIRLRTKPRIIKRHLLPRVHGRVRTATRGPVELVDIAAFFVEPKPTSLTGAAVAASQRRDR